MRECFSLFMWKYKDPQTREIRLKYYKRIMFKKYYDGTPIWKMIINDTWFDIKRKLKSNTQ